jgi:hypothetical protein
LLVLQCASVFFELYAMQINSLTLYMGRPSFATEAQQAQTNHNNTVKKKHSD